MADLDLGTVGATIATAVGVDFIPIAQKQGDGSFTKKFVPVSGLPQPAAPPAPKLKRVLSCAFPAPSVRKYIVLLANELLSSVDSVSVYKEGTGGSCSLAIRIADSDGTNATAVGGMGNITVTGTVQTAGATGANTMQVTGTTDRRLIVDFLTSTGFGAEEEVVVTINGTAA